MAWVACVADARPLDSYIRILGNAGLSVRQIENHDKALADLIQEIRGKLLGMELLVKLNKIDLPFPVDWDEAGYLARNTADLVREGNLGYVLLAADAPPGVIKPGKTVI